MKNVYKVTYDIRVGREWLAPNNPSGWASRHVLANGDARAACARVEQEEKKRSSYDGKRVNAVRVIKVECVASDVLI